MSEEWPEMWSRVVIEAERRNCMPEFLLWELLRDARAECERLRRTAALLALDATAPAELEADR